MTNFGGGQALALDRLVDTVLMLVGVGPKLVS
jgi:hypothetical protein